MRNLDVFWIEILRKIGSVRKVPNANKPIRIKGFLMISWFARFKNRFGKLQKNMKKRSRKSDAKNIGKSLKKSSNIDAKTIKKNVQKSMRKTVQKKLQKTRTLSQKQGTIPSQEMHFLIGCLPRRFLQNSVFT